MSDLTPAQWQALVAWYTARRDGTPVHEVERIMDRAFGGPEAAIRALTAIDGQARRCGVPALDIAIAGTEPAQDRPPVAGHAARRLPVVVVSTRPAPLPLSTPGRVATHARPGNVAAPRSPQAGRAAGPVGRVLAAPAPLRAERWAVYALMAGAAVMPVLLAVSMWKGSR